MLLYDPIDEIALRFQLDSIFHLPIDNYLDYALYPYFDDSGLSTFDDADVPF